MLEVQAHLAAARVLHRPLEAELRGSLPHHQRLAAAHEQRDGAIAGVDLRSLHIFVDVTHQLIALIQQIVGHTASRHSPADLRVQRRDLAGQAVDHVHIVGHLLLGVVVQLIELTGSQAKARSQLVHACEHHVARSQIRGSTAHIGKRIQHVVDCSAQAIAAARKHFLHLIERLRARRVRCADRAGRCRLTVEQLAEVAQDGRHIGAIADIAIADVLARRGLEGHALARIAGGVDVGNVVPRGLQGDLVGHQGACAHVQKTHDWFSVILLICAARALTPRRLATLALLLPALATVTWATL
ncbi:hypothetical protein SDC9_147033 [bioreactor metagenome]|uniref:Uncharacterized protein n=1 Tax=bioreactor metagenome TaxID=1076179 RepID=A0A645EFF0_9ZZZZ